MLKILYYMAIGTILSLFPAVLGQQRLSHMEAVQQLLAAGISHHSSGTCSNRNNPRCTSFENVRQNTISMVVNLKRQSGCPMVLTGGTEVGHGGGSRSKSHYNGFKVDVRKNSCLSAYILRNAKFIGNTRRREYPAYRDASGTIFLDESNHWDILFP